MLSISAIRRPDRRLVFLDLLGRLAGRLPQPLELVVGDEDPAAFLLEDRPQLRVRDVDRLLAERGSFAFRGGDLLRRRLGRLGSFLCRLAAAKKVAA